MGWDLWVGSLNLHFIRETKRVSYAGLRQTEEVSNHEKKQQQMLQPSGVIWEYQYREITNSHSGLVKDQDGFSWGE